MALLRICLLLVLCILTQGDSLSNKLQQVSFKHQDATHSTDSYENVNIPCIYLEPENQTRSDYAWAIENQCPYTFLSNPPKTPPPIGVRSAVPLGGIASGSIELRATGRLHEWTIMNQSPSGGAKFNFFDNAFFAVRTNNNSAVTSKTIRTHPPAGVPGVSTINYSGAYPLSRLAVGSNEFPLDLSLFAYSRYRVGDMSASALPGIAFTLVAKNPTNAPVETSFMFNLPYGIERDYERQSGQVLTTLNSASPEDCFASCQSNSACQSWTWKAPTCILNKDVPLPSYTYGFSSGLKSSWTRVNQGGVSCLTNTMPSPGPEQGTLSLCSAQSPSFTSTTDYSSVWSAFSQNGGFSSANPPANLPSGAIAVTATVPAGQTTSLTITLSWYFPNRPYLTQNIGNYYTTLFTGAEQAADVLNTNLENTVTDIISMQQPFFDSSLPDWLSDMYVNSLSHIRSAFWTKDGRWRQWEAYDCVNIDSVHNDGERHIPYIMFFPDSTRSKMKSWAKWQLGNGMIQEQLACGCTNGIDPGFDFGCGRIMSDVSSMFITYVWELYHWANDVTSLKEFYPAVKKAAQWHISVSETFGIPYRLVSTYDILGLDQYNVTAYNSVFHMLAMRAAQELALAMNDTAFATVCSNAYTVAQKSMDQYLYNTTGGYYNAYWGIPPGTKPYYTPGALQADSFYAQVLAYTSGLGTLGDMGKMMSHLQAERKKCSTPLGFLILVGRYPYPGPWIDNAVWMMANPNWATLNIHTASNPQQVQDALSVEEQTIDWWRTKLHDIWNVAGITGGLGYGAEGQPYITSHYGYFMSCWHTMFALSGQQADLPAGTLSFTPKTAAPFKYPVMLPGVLGQVSQDGGNSFTLSLNFGSLQLSKLSIGSVVCNNVKINAGEVYTCKPSE